MRRGVVIAFAILGLSACGQSQDQTATSAGGAASGGAAPDVAAAANQDATNCLDLVGVGNYEQAVPVCASALSADATNEKVKGALDIANAKLAEMAASAAQGAADTAAEAADAAQGAADVAEDAADKADEAVPAPKSY